MYESTDKMVSHPDHYQAENGMEVINVIEAFTAGLTGVEAYDAGNIIKYACRWSKKNGIQDLEKIIWYATHLIDYLKRKGEEPEEIKDVGCKINYNSYYKPEGQDVVHDYTVDELVKRYVALHKEEKIYSYIISSSIISSNCTYTAEYVPGKKNTIRLKCDSLRDEYFRYNHSIDWNSWYEEKKNRFKCKQKTTKTKPITYICRNCGCKRTVRLSLNSIIPGSWESCRRCGGVTYTPEILAIWRKALKIEDVKESLKYFKEEVTKLFKKEFKDEQ